MDMNIKRKSLRDGKGFISENEKIFQEKQKIAIAKFGDLFEDEVFFALELEYNDELKKEINREFNSIYRSMKIMN